MTGTRYRPAARGALATLALTTAPVLLAATGCALPRGETLLRQGQPAAALAAVRPQGAAAYRLRSRALRALGRLRDARTELRISLAIDPGSAEGHRLLGDLEAQLGNRGAELFHLQRSLVLQPRQPAVRRAVAQLLVRRALLRRDHAVGLGQHRAAAVELDRAREIDPLSAATTARDASAAVRPDDCPGVPATDWRAPASRPVRCRVARPDRQLQRVRDRYLLVGCAGVQLARWLEAQGCVDPALAVWRALQQETPEDHRWVRELARLTLVQGRSAAAELLLTDYVYLAPDRARAQLDAARLLLDAGARRWAGARAIRALALARRLEDHLEAIRLLRASGMSDEARAARGHVLARSRQFTLPEDDLRARLEQALTGE